MLENPYTSVKLTTKEINDDLTKLRNNFKTLNSTLTFLSQINKQLENLKDLYDLF